MQTRLLAVVCAAVVALASPASAEIKVVTEHKAKGDATPAFDFKNVPHAAKSGLTAKVSIVDGDSDSNGGGLEKLTDGQLPSEEDQPTENFFFDAGTPGGRVRFDFGDAKPIGQINTYSWHTDTRAPQVYKVYGATGTAADFNSSPKTGTDPVKCGWTLISAVDTRSKDGEPGGQYGVSITDSAGPIGSYRYLLFDIAATETDDSFGNTFYSEISVLPVGGVEGAGVSEKGGITVLTDHNEAGDATAAFKFKHVPSPAKKGTPGKFNIINGESDANAGGIEKLTDGQMPTEEDQPSENFFFAAGAPGGRLRLDLGEAKPIAQINSYSWHGSSRAPQVYKVYGSDGGDAGFNSFPKSGIDPSKCGWTFIAAVDTRPKDGEPGGQYAASIRNHGGLVGKYRYLLFACSPSETEDAFGNTFYSEINVLGPDEVTPDGASTGDASAAPAVYVAHTADGKYEIDFNTSRAPDLTEWVTNKLAPALLEWYPKIVEYFPSEGYEAPKKFTVTFKNGPGVADTRGTLVTAYNGWIRKQLKGEAIGSLVHECVHVVQQYGAAHRHNAHPTEDPGYLVEGIADYYRWYHFEPQSKGAEIRRRGLDRANYNGSYRITANFLNWVSGKYRQRPRSAA